MKLFTRSLGVATAALLLAGTANAATVLTSVYSSNVVSDTETDYSTTLTIPKFDTSLGSLQTVYLTLYGDVVGDIAFENKGASAADVTSKLSASITLQRPDGSTLVVTVPVYEQTNHVSAYDGHTDFDGTSGLTLTGITANSNSSVTLALPADLALFQGSSDLTALLSATAKSVATGPGNLATAYSTTAGGYATVQYAYDNTASVPEPASWAMMVGGFGLLGGALRRKRTSSSVRFG